MNIPAAVDSHIEANLERYLDDVIALCHQPSVSARKEGTRECAALVEALLVNYGCDVTRIEGYGDPILVGRIAGKSERTLLFYNHYDVQPPEPLDLWDSPPYEPTLRDGALYARGAKDDKGELVARLAAVDAIRAAHGGELPCGALFVVEGEEEIGSPHIADFVRDHVDLLRCHGSIWEEGGIGIGGHPQVSIGTRGMLAVEIAVEAMARDAHSGYAHVLPNAAWRLTWALATLKESGEHILIDGFYDDALPPSPTDLAIFERQPPFAEAEYRAMFGLNAFAGNRSREVLTRAIFEPTCTLQGITTGYQGQGVKTVIPARASAKLDFRLVPNQQPPDILDKLRRHLDSHGYADVKITYSDWMFPARTAADDPLVRLTAQAGEEVYGLPAHIQPLGTGGSSPRYAFQGPLNIPIVTAGVGYWDSRTHAPNEHIRLIDFQNAARQLARVLDGFAEL
jgi:acetylornithine deacetylase/succinyl-diaminopimelate desuccinylase-like protein